MKSKRFFHRCALRAGCLAATARGQTAAYSLTDIGTIPAVFSGYMISVPTGINNRPSGNTMRTETAPGGNHWLARGTGGKREWS
jgi:hypothetical protein